MEPVFADFVAAVAGDVGHEGFEFIAGEVFDAATVLAEEQVVVAGNLGNKGLTAVGVVYPLNGTEFFEFFEGAVNGHKAEAGTFLSGKVIHIGGAEGTIAGGHRFNNGAPRGCESVAVAL